VKYLNNTVEQDHRFIKKRIRPMLGLKSLRTARGSAIMYSVVETAKENNLSPYHYLRYLFETLPNIDLNNKEEIDKVLPWSMDLPSSCRVPKKVKQTKNNSKINFYCIFWSYLTFTLKMGRNFGHPFTI